MHQKNHQTPQLVRSPALSNVVRISQVGTRIKLEVLIIIPARLPNRCEFILVGSVFILHDAGKYTRRHQHKGHARDTSERENRLGRENVMRAFKHVHVRHVRVFFLPDYS